MILSTVWFEPFRLSMDWSRVLLEKAGLKVSACNVERYREPTFVSVHWKNHASPRDVMKRERVNKEMVIQYALLRLFSFPRAKCSSSMKKYIITRVSIARRIG